MNESDAVRSPTAAQSRRARGLSRVLTFGVPALVLVADVATKAAARSLLEPGEPLQVIGGLLRLRLGYNSGIAFGLLTDGGGGLLLLTGLIGLALVAWLVVSERDRASWRRTLPLGLIIGGAFGNIIDRLPDGLVTDYLDIGLGAARWPSFNLADSAIVVGVLGLIVLSPDPPPDRSS